MSIQKFIPDDTDTALYLIYDRDGCNVIGVDIPWSDLKKCVDHYMMTDHLTEDEVNIVICKMTNFNLKFHRTVVCSINK
jgi:hypothetical protein